MRHVLSPNMCNGHGAINSQRKNVRFLRMKQFHGRWCVVQKHHHHEGFFKGLLKSSLGVASPQHGESSTDPTLSLMHFRRFQTQMVIFQSCMEHLFKEELLRHLLLLLLKDNLLAHENYHMSHSRHPPDFEPKPHYFFNAIIYLSVAG